VFACRHFCKPLSDVCEALWSPSCDSTWSLTSARGACTGGVEKFGSPARKTFFDSIGQVQTIQHVSGDGGFLQELMHRGKRH
jgi:hypothetical protein